MSTYLITYDLKKPGQDYKNLHDAIKATGAWWHYLESTWLVVSSSSAQAVFDRLRPHIDANDRVLVIKVTNENAGWLTQEAWDWINQNIRAYA